MGTGKVRKSNGARLNSALGYVAQEGQIAQDVERHGRPPDGPLARQAPLPVVYRTAVTQRGTLKQPDAQYSVLLLDYVSGTAQYDSQFHFRMCYPF